MKPVAYYDATEKTFTLSAADAAKSRSKGHVVYDLFEQAQVIGKFAIRTVIWNKSIAKFCLSSDVFAYPSRYEWETHEIVNLFYVQEIN